MFLEKTTQKGIWALGFSSIFLLGSLLDHDLANVLDPANSFYPCLQKTFFPFLQLSFSISLSSFFWTLI